MIVLKGIKAVFAKNLTDADIEFESSSKISL